MEFVIIGTIVVVALLLWAAWKVLTIDWFGIHYDDPTSPYYHDKTGKGRGK